MTHRWRRCLCASLCLGWLIISQHRGSDGALWWRAETKSVTEDVCRRLLKETVGHPTVGFTKWYDVTPAQIHDRFGSVATVDHGTWLGCWPSEVWRNGNTVWGEPDA